MNDESVYRTAPATAGLLNMKVDMCFRTAPASLDLFIRGFKVYWLYMGRVGQGVGGKNGGSGENGRRKKTLRKTLVGESYFNLFLLRT